MASEAVTMIKKQYPIIFYAEVSLWLAGAAWLSWTVLYLLFSFIDGSMLTYWLWNLDSAGRGGLVCWHMLFQSFGLLIATEKPLKTQLKRALGYDTK